MDVESEVYATVPISEFGAAMLRGMGWTGGDGGGGDNDDDSNHNKGGDKRKKDDDVADSMKPRHHRLGLGAAPRPVSMSAKVGTTKPGGGRHRALRPHEVERAEREEREEEEWRRRAEERVKLNKQRTAQVGSVVRIRVSDTDAAAKGDGGDEDTTKTVDGDVVSRRRAILVKTAGVPGLNQVLIRYENTAEDVSVRKSDVVLIGQDELDEKPFVEMKRPAKTKKSSAESGEEKKEASHADAVQDQSGGTSRDEWNRSRRRDGSIKGYRNDEDRRDRDPDGNKRSDRDRRERDDDRRDRDRYGDDDRHRGKRSSRDRRDSDRRRSKDGERDRRRRERDRDDEYESSRDRKRSKKKDSRSSGRSSDDRPSSSEPDPPSPSTVRWLTPNIRVRVITKKLAKGRQYKEKGIVLDVLPGGSHATVQMADGEVLDRVPDRYLETALPRVGGNVIVLAAAEGEDRQHQYAKGRLLERNSDKGRGVVQLFEDMNVLTLSLDDIAEWCGPLDEDMMG